MKDPEFWHKKWASNQIGFHLEDVNPLLIEYWPHLSPQRNESVLVPLCGKSEDLIWLASQHEQVQGVELSEIAVRSFFAEHFYTPTVTRLSGAHELYQFDELMIYTGDVFSAPLQAVELIYDRAALVALPPEMRKEYVIRLLSLLKDGGRVLLVTLDYVQSEMTGPPFCVAQDEVEVLFAGCKVTCLFRDDADQHHPKISQRGLNRFAEVVWLIEK